MHVFSEHEMFQSIDLETLILTFNTLGTESPFKVSMQNEEMEPRTKPRKANIEQAS